MDRLRQSMDVLRGLALHASDQNIYLLAEREIGRYLEDPAASPEALKEAITNEAVASQRNAAFWATIQEFLSRPGSEV
jgi:hypothetical protein